MGLQNQRSLCQNGKSQKVLRKKNLNQQNQKNLYPNGKNKQLLRKKSLNQLNQKSQFLNGRNQKQPKRKNPNLQNQKNLYPSGRKLPQHQLTPNLSQKLNPLKQSQFLNQLKNQSLKSRANQKVVIQKHLKQQSLQVKQQKINLKTKQRKRKKKKMLQE